MAGSMAVSGVSVRDVNTGKELIRIHAWPAPFPGIGDVLWEWGAHGIIRQRTFRSYGLSWGVTLWIDTTDKGYSTEMFMGDSNAGAK